MGEEVHRDEELAVVNLEHVKRISDTFRTNRLKKKGSIPKTVVQEIWKNRLAPRFYSTLMNVMFPEDTKEVSFLSFYTIYKNLAEPEAEIMFRALTIYHIATIHEPPFNYEQADEYPNAPLKNIKDYVCDVITSYLHAIIHINMREALGWLDLRAPNSLVDGNLVAAYLLKDLESHRNEVSIGSLEIWLEKNEIYYTVSEQLYLYLFGVNKSIDVKSLIPFPIVQTGKNSKTLLSLPDVLLLNSKLPKRAPRWTLAFMLDSRSGDWETFKQIIHGKGQTLIVIQDSNGDIFGMYGSQQWFPSSGFYGNDQSFLFTLKPEVNVYEGSGRNNNFQIVTESGIGMGGTEEHFGLFINYGAKTGLTSLSCSTFRQFWPLARELDFKIEQFELWIISEDPVAGASEVIILDLACDKEKNFDLLSKNLDVSKLTSDLSRTELIETSNSKKMTEQDVSRTMKDSSGPIIHNALEQKLSKIEISLDKKGDRVVKEIVEETKIEATSVVQEALQKQRKRSKGGQCRKVIAAETGQSCEDKSLSLVKGEQIRSYVKKCNKDLLRSPTAELSNVKTPHEGHGSNVSHNLKDSDANDNSARLHGSFVHPSLKAKDEPNLLETLKNQKSPSPPIRKTTAEKNNDDITIIKHPNKRNGKSLLDVQIQVGETKILPLKCRLSSKKHCACAVKSPCYCARPTPMVKNTYSIEKYSKLTISSEGQNNIPTCDTPSTNLLSMTTVSPSSPNNNNVEIIQQPINEPVNSVTIVSVTEELTTAESPTESGGQEFQTSTITSQVKIDLEAGSKEVGESCSATGCRCSSSTETSSGWEGGGVANTLDRLKLKSECSCELSTTVLGDMDVASKCRSDDGCTITKTLGQTDTVGKLKEASSSMCSCVLGPKDKGVISSSQEKQPMSDITSGLISSKKETQDLTRSCWESTVSLESGESVKSSKSVSPMSSNIKYRFSRFPEKETQCLTRSCRKSNIPLKSGEGVKLSKPMSSEVTDGVFRSPTKESQRLTRSCRKSDVSLESRKSVRLSNSVPSHCLGPKAKKARSSSHEKQPSPTDVRNESLLSSNTSPTKSRQKNNISFESGECVGSSNSMPPTSHVLCIGEEALICSSQEKHVVSTEITNESARSSKKETQYLTRLSKKRATSLDSGASTRSSTSIPPTCLTCRSMVKTSGCQCKTRSSSKLTPILEQASELLQQHRLSERSSILKSERRSNSKSISKRGSSAVFINIQDTSLNAGCSVCSCDVTAKTSADHSRLSRSCRCSGNEANSRRCFCKSKTLNNLDSSQKDIKTTENSTGSKSKDTQAASAVSTKKTCQCSLPRNCFPQFPEDHIQVEDNLKKCGCGTHAGAVIRFPTFPEPEESSQAANMTSTSRTEAASDAAAGTEGSGKGKGQGGCPCVEEDGTIIILNVSKCNTMEALEKIVQELDVKYRPVTPQHLPALSGADSSAKLKPCNSPEGFDRDAIKRLLDNKMMRPPKEHGELKNISPPE